ncbi:MAG: mRNA surveillance protein Pelota, partial [Nanoarchaeota archaeon]
MDLIRTDFKKGTVILRVTDLDDLWYLSHIIERGDVLTAKTTRKIKLGEGENAKVVKKTLTLTIEA